MEARGSKEGSNHCNESVRLCPVLVLRRAPRGVCEVLRVSAGFTGASWKRVRAASVASAVVRPHSFARACFDHVSELGGFLGGL